MQMKAVNRVFATIVVLVSVFSTIAFARPSFDRLTSGLRSYHSSSQFLLSPNVPSLDELWETVLRQSAKAKAYADKVLTETKNSYQDVSSKIDSFKLTMDELIKESKEFRVQLETSNISLDEISKELSKALEGVGEAILDEFKDPLPENQDERYKRREEIIAFALDKIEAAFVEVCGALGLERAKAKAMFERIRPKLHHIVSVAGNIIDRHPVLLETIIFSGVFMLVPEAWFLRPLLRVFGFGPAGPVKGSMAAWMQRVFWGGFVKEGSWFAFLQRAGMKGVGWGWKVIGGIIGGIGAVGGTRGC